MMMTIKMVAHAGIASVQNLMMTLHATISNGTRAASKMKKLYPAANPKPSSTQRPAKRMKGDEIGKYVTISAIPGDVVSLTLPSTAGGRDQRTARLTVSHAQDY